MECEINEPMNGEQVDQHIHDIHASELSIIRGSSWYKMSLYPANN